MRTVHVVTFNHMDPIWRRCWEDHFEYDSQVVRSYSELEDRQIGSYMDMLRQYPQFAYSIEQTISIKKFLENNPDRAGEFAALVREGRLEILGGGETVIDYNLVCGESIVRNHFYSRLYCREHFGRMPKYADCPDTFGLSAQLPQVFRQLGYDAITCFSRVFPGARPVWRGLNGDQILLGTLQGADAILADGEKYAVCGACRGQGCGHCGQTGVDYSYRLCSWWDPVEHAMGKLAATGKDDMLLVILTEETLADADLPERLEAAAGRHGLAVRFTTAEAYTDEFHKRLLAAVKTNGAPQEDIDPRAEGNPMATGCYITRIGIKQQNRELENMLLSAERFAAVASLSGFPYPSKKFGRLWNQLALVQFHDCITASHCDAAYEELLTLCRKVRADAASVYDAALRHLERDVGVPDKAGWHPVLLFNPLPWEVEQISLEVFVRLGRDSKEEWAEVSSADGALCPVTGVEAQTNRAGRTMRVTFLASLPPLGYRLFYVRAKDAGAPHGASAAATGDSRLACIENEYYRIVAGDTGIQKVIDKQLGETILTDGAGMLAVADDIGHPWGRGMPPIYSERLDKPYFGEHVTARRHEIEVAVIPGGDCSRITVKGAYSCAERRIGQIAWEQTVTLYRGIRRIFYRTEVDWDTASTRLFARFPLTFAPDNEKAWYEIPFGMLERGSVVSSGQLGVEAEWPALNWFAVHNGRADYSVAVANKGLPGCRVAGSQMELHLLRSPEHWHCGFDCDGAKDKGRHVFEYAVSSWRGGPAEGNPARMGAELNASLHSVPANVKAGKLPPQHSYWRNSAPNVMLSALKRAEDGPDLIARYYEAYGLEADDALPGEVFQDTLMETGGGGRACLHYRPFEIKTLRIKARGNHGIEI